MRGVPEHRACGGRYARCKLAGGWTGHLWRGSPQNSDTRVLRTMPASYALDSAILIFGGLAGDYNRRAAASVVVEVCARGVRNRRRRRGRLMPRAIALACAHRPACSAFCMAALDQPSIVIPKPGANRRESAATESQCAGPRRACVCSAAQTAHQPGAFGGQPDPALTSGCAVLSPNTM